MKLLFVHDGPIFVDNQDNYYEYSYHNIYEKYSYLANDIIFITRVEKIYSNTTGTKMPSEIKIVRAPNYKSPSLYLRNHKTTENIIKNIIKNIDMLVIRQSSLGWLARKYAILYNKPYIVEVVGNEWDSLWNHSILGKFIAPICQLHSKRNILKSSFVHYVTKMYLQKIYPTKGKSVGVSDVVVKAPNENVLGQRRRRINNLTKNKVIHIGTAAAIDVKYKGQQFVIKAIKRLNNNGYNIIYHLAGTNKTDSKYLLKLTKKYNLEDNVRFHGSLPQSKMNEFYDSLDIYIQPSLQEGLPRSVIEAMSRGCPCLGSNIAGLPELLDQRFLFKKKNVRDIEKKIIWILNHAMHEASRMSFDNSKNYTKQDTDKIREGFYDEFLKSFK